MHRIGGDQNIPGGIVHITLGWKDLMRSVPRLYPFPRNKLACEILRRVLLNLIIRVSSKHPKSSDRTAAAWMNSHRRIMEVVKTRAARSEEGAGKIRQPQCAERVDRSFAAIPRNIQFTDIERDGRRHAVVTPDLHDVADALRFFVKRTPRDLARLKWIMLERHERQVGQAIVSFQIIDKSSQPRSTSLRIRPDLDVFVHSLKHRTAEPDLRINFVQRLRPLQVQRPVVFRKHILSICFLAYFDKRNWISTRFQILNLIGGILRSAVDQRNRYHRAQAARVAAGVKKIKPHLISLVIDI